MGNVGRRRDKKGITGRKKTKLRSKEKLRGPGTPAQKKSTLRTGTRRGGTENKEASSGNSLTTM